MESVNNPVRIQDESGRYIDPRKEPNRLGTLNSHIVLVDSRDRNVTKYSSANNFSLKLPQEFRNVLSVQLLRVHMPVPASMISAADGLEPFVAVRCPQLKRVEQCYATVGDIAFNDFCNDAFALVPLTQETTFNTGLHTAVWEPRSYPVVKRFTPWKGKMDKLDLSLWVRDNGVALGELAYPLVADTGNFRLNENNWQMLLEIVCQN